MYIFNRYIDFNSLDLIELVLIISLIITVLAIIILLLILGYRTLFIKKKIKQLSSNNIESIEQIKLEKIEDRIAELEQTLQMYEDNFSSLMYQLNDISQDMNSNFLKLAKFIKNNVREERTFVEETPKEVNEIKKEEPKINEPIKENIDNVSPLLKVNAINRNINMLESNNVDIDEIAKKLNLSKGEIELVKNLSSLRGDSND